MSFAPLVAQLLLNSVVRPRRKPARVFKAELALAALAGFFIFAGSIFMLIAFYNLLLVYYTPPLAALIAGVALYVVALLTAITARLMLRKPAVIEAAAPSVEDQVHSIAKLIETTLSSVKREVDAPVQDNPVVSLLIASVTGFLAARQFRG